MTQKEEENKMLETSDVKITWRNINQVTDLATNPTYDTKYSAQNYSPEQVDLNISEGTGAWCLDTMVRHKDLMTARERIKGDRDAGKSYEDELREMKRITGGKLFKAGQVRIGKSIFKIHQENRTKEEEDARKKRTKKNQEYSACVAAASTLLASGVNHETKITRKQLKILIAPYKRKEDPAVPSRKADLLEYYLAIRHRPLRNVYPVNDALESNEDNDEDAEDFAVDESEDQSELAAAMLSLSEYSSENLEDNVEPMSV